jgi:hypothetical protein
MPTITSFLQKTVAVLFLSTKLIAQSCDIVYTWVDGADENWRKIKNTYLELEGKHELIQNDASTDDRFRDRQELRYSLRSIFKYAPFVSHIYIVTMDQKPDWIKDDPKITFINHKTLFKNQAYLPTFNSQAIESHLHLIPNLSEHFLYFNDDVFLGNNVSFSDFFSEDGMPKVFLEKGESPKGPIFKDETTYRRAWRNTNFLLDLIWGELPRYRMKHTPFPMRKSFIEIAEKDFPFVFETNASHRFRSTSDFTLINGLLQYHWIYQQKAVISTISNMMVSLRPKHLHSLNEKNILKLKKEDPKTFCIEDVSEGKYDQLENLLKDFLNEKYPDKAPWEKD